MRTCSTAWRTLIAYSHPIVTIVESWLGGTQLAANVPITSGQIDMDDSGSLKRLLRIKVPARTPDGRRWDPAGDALAPLAAYGQRLKVSTGIRYANGATELLLAGWFVITSWDRKEDEGVIQVQAADLGLLIQDDRMLAPEAPPANATFTSEFVRLVNGTVPTAVSAALVDRALSSTVVWDRDRDKALTDLCNAWPARWYVDDTGTARADVPYGAVSPSTPAQVRLTDGSGGTITSRARKAQRTAIFNMVVVDGKAGATGAAAPHSVASVTMANSPIRATGPFGRRPQFFSSDLIGTQAQADATAQAMLVQVATMGRAEALTCVPDPSIQLGDVAEVMTRDGDRYVSRIVNLSLPLTAEDGPMSIVPAMLPGGGVT